MKLSTLFAICLMPVSMLVGCDESDNNDGNLVGGTIEEQDFPEEWAKAWCGRQEECAQADFEDEWTGQDECKDSKSDDAEFNADWSDLLCESYSEEAASECIQAIESMDCDDWANEEWRNECEAVYGC